MSTASVGQGWYARNHRKLDWSFFVLFLALLLWSVLDFFGWLPGEQGYRPEQMILISGALLAQSAGSLVGSRSRRAQFALLALCAVLLIWSFVNR